MDQIRSATTATIQGRPVILAGTNNYLGSPTTPTVVQPPWQPSSRSAPAPRDRGWRAAITPVTGHWKRHSPTPSAGRRASSFSTGYQANLGALSVLAGEGEFMLVDADSHASIHDGCRMSNATTIRFPAQRPGKPRPPTRAPGRRRPSHADRRREPLQHAGRPRPAARDRRSQASPWRLAAGR